jgi:hypothetical protein
MGEAAPKRSVNRERVDAHKARMLAEIRAYKRRPNLFAVVGLLLAAFTIALIILEATT